MTYLEKFKATLDNLEEKKLVTYFLAVAGGTFGLLLLCSLYYFYARHSWYVEIDELNQLRKTKIHRILTRATQFQQQQKEAQEILEKERDFKIVEYIETILREYNLKSTRIELPPETDKGMNYIESSTDFSLTGINMMQLVKLLQKFEENKRIYIKKLEIVRSKLIQRSLDVNIIIATLLPK